jgi:hypothetical protein
LAGNSILEFVGVIVVFLITLWWIIRGLYRRHISKGVESANE